MQDRRCLESKECEFLLSDRLALSLDLDMELPQGISGRKGSLNTNWTGLNQVTILTSWTNMLVVGALLVLPSGDLRWMSVEWEMMQCHLVAKGMGRQ